MAAPSRRVAVLVWLSMLLAPVVFAAVTQGVSARPEAPQLAGLFRWMAAAVAGLGILVSRLVPPRFGPRGAAAAGEAAALFRMAVAWAVLEGAALFVGVALLVTGDPWLWLVLAVVLAALTATRPGARRWASPTSPPLPGPGGHGPAER